MTSPCRALRITTVLALLAVAGCVQPPQPICARAEVVQEVGRVVKAWNTYNAIDPDSVTEAPTGRSDSVACRADMTGLGYVPTADGWRPAPYRESRRYDVQVSGGRFFVQVPPPAPRP